MSGTTAFFSIVFYHLKKIDVETKTSNQQLAQLFMGTFRERTVAGGERTTARPVQQPRISFLSSKRQANKHHCRARSNKPRNVHRIPERAYRPCPVGNENRCGYHPAKPPEPAHLRMNESVEARRRSKTMRGVFDVFGAVGRTKNYDKRMNRENSAKPNKTDNPIRRVRNRESSENSDSEHQIRTEPNPNQNRTHSHHICRGTVGANND